MNLSAIAGVCNLYLNTDKHGLFQLCWVEKLYIFFLIYSDSEQRKVLKHILYLNIKCIIIQMYIYTIECKIKFTKVFHYMMDKIFL